MQKWKIYSNFRVPNWVCYKMHVVPLGLASVLHCNIVAHLSFFWLLLHDRLNTRDLLARKNFPLPSYECATLQCNQQETLIHLFWNCPFASQCWDFICPLRNNNLSPLEAVHDMRDKINQPFFMEIIILAAWGIWMVRNNKIFKNIRPSFQEWKVIFFNELKNLNCRIRAKYAHQFQAWRHLHL